MSTLSEGDEIEERFYRLKAQEWACETYQAERAIKNVLEIARVICQRPLES